MTKPEAEAKLRHLFGVWAVERGIVTPSVELVSFAEFKRWLSASGYSHYLNFRSLGGADAAAERWFDDHFGQAWRN